MSDPSNIGRFVVKEPIGAGRMGQVYRAWDPKLLRDVALKKLHLTDSCAEENRRRILEEARLAAALRHPAVVIIYDIIEEDGEHYLVEEYVEGSCLRTLLGRPFSPSAFYTFLVPCAEALCRAAARGIVHCDIKPENLMVDPEGRPRILDFGLARVRLDAQRPIAPAGGLTEPALSPESARSARSTEPTLPENTHGFAGTPAYISPEVLRGLEPDHRADIFSLGIVCYEMLSGANPFLGSTRPEIYASILGSDVPPLHRKNPEVGDRLSQLVARMLQKDRDLRPMAIEVHEIARFLAAEETGGERIAGMIGPSCSRPGAGTPRPLVLVEPFIEDGDAGSTPSHHGHVEFAEAIRSRLARIRGIDVIDSVHGAGATIVVSGSITNRGGMICVSHRILNRPRDLVIDSGSVEGPPEDPFGLLRKVSDGIAQAVAGAFGIPMENAGAGVRTHAPSLDPAASDYYHRAKVYLRRGQDERDAIAAAQLCERALALDPGSALAKAALAEAGGLRYFLTKDPKWAEQAITHAHEAFSMAPGLPEVRLAMAEVYLTTGKAALALSTYVEILRQDPWNYAALIGLARAQMESGRTVEAESAFLEAIQIQPEHWLGHNHLGVFYRRQGRTRDALRCFLRVVDLAPDLARGYSNLGAAYTDLGRVDEAIAAFRHSIEIGKDYRALSNLATLYFSQRQYTEAAATYEEALTLDDRDHRVWNNLALALRNMGGRSEDAGRAQRKALDLAERRREISPSDPVLLVNIGQYNGDLGNHDAAVWHVERALELAPDRIDVLLPAAAAYGAAGLIERACKAVERALALGCHPDVLRRDPLFEQLLREPAVQSIIAHVESRGDEPVSKQESNEVVAVLKIGIRDGVVFTEPERLPRIKQGQAVELRAASTDLAFCVFDAGAFRPSSAVVVASASVVMEALHPGAYRVGVHVPLNGKDSPRFPMLHSRMGYSSAVMIVEKGDQFPTVSDVNVTKMGPAVLLTPPSPHYVKTGGAIRWHARDDSIRVRFDQGGVTDPEGEADKGDSWGTRAVSTITKDTVDYPYVVWSPKDAREGVHIRTAYAEFTIEIG